MTERIKEAAAFIRNRCNCTPESGIILGSGLGNFSNSVNVSVEIPYTEIPGFPVSTVKGHSGKLIFGDLGGKQVVVMAGRFHIYEGYTAEDIVLPVRVMKMLGVKNLFISNAAGGVNKDFKVGDLMLITDHISQFVPSPLIGKNDDNLGPRFPDMMEPYDSSILTAARAVAQANDIEYKEGVYVCVTGPAFETPAEYRMIDRIGGDAVGMSTVQEVTAGVHMGLKCFAVSIITDIWVRVGAVSVSHDEVLEAAKKAEPKLALLFRELIPKI